MSHRICWLLLGVLLLGATARASDVGASGDGAAETEPEQRAQDDEVEDTSRPRTEIAGQTTTTLPVYVRPRGAAGGREGGGTRGTTGVEVVALLPSDHVALTTRAEPTLYWYLSAPTEAAVELVVSRGEEEQPLLERPLEASAGAGIHAIDLAGLGLALDPGVVYRWYVQLRAGDAKRPMLFRYAGGSIERVEAGAALEEELAAAGPTGRATVYARHGIWCDALDAALRETAQDPSEARAKSSVRALLEQVGLQELAGNASRTEPSD